MLRGMVLWTALILLALGLAWFIGAVAVPVWQIRRIVAEARVLDPQAAVERLGGEAAAARKLAMYRRLPAWLAPYNQPFEVDLFGYCGQAGAPHLIDIIRREAGETRLCALKAFTFKIRAPREAASALALALDEDSESAHCYALRALERMGPLAGDALPALERELWATGEAAWPTLAASAIWAINPERLLAFLHDPDPERRADAVDYVAQVAKFRRDARAIEALAGLGQAAAAAIPCLQELAKDGDEPVRSAAAEALKKIRGEEAPK